MLNYKKKIIKEHDYQIFLQSLQVQSIKVVFLYYDTLIS